MKVIIIGAGGQAQVVAGILHQDPRVSLEGFIDIDNAKKGQLIDGKPILGSHRLLLGLRKKGVKHAIIAIGDNEIRKQRFLELKKLGFTMINAIDNSANISKPIILGEGVVIAPGVNISFNVKIGDNCIINTACVVEHNSCIGNHTHIGPNVAIAGSTTIGNQVFIGIGSSIIDFLKIGNNITIGAGSVVLSNIPDNCTAVGAPAKVIKINNQKI